MSNVDLSTEKPETAGIQLPLDGLIRFIANRVGGDQAKEVERFLKFIFIGMLGAVIDFGISNLLTLTILPPIPPFENLKVGTAITISFTAAVLSNYFWNRYWTYPDSRSRSVRRQLVQFAIVSIFGWSIRTTWVIVMDSQFAALAERVLTAVAPSLVADWSSRVYTQIGLNVALLIGVTGVMVWNFFVNRYWTFNDVD